MNYLANHIDPKVRGAQKRGIDGEPVAIINVDLCS
jgi:hypothetical protein